MLSRRDECRQKFGAVVRYLESKELQAAILTRRANFIWFTAGGLNHVGTGSDLGSSSLLITREKVVCITKTIEEHRVTAEEMADLGIEVRAYPWWDNNEAARIWAAELGDRPAAADAPVAAIGRPLPPLGAEFDALRQQLNEAEIERYRKAGPEVAAALETACRQARPGMTEYELAGRILRELMERGFRSPTALVANEERVRRFRHPLPTKAKITKYGMGVCGAERDGLYVSVSRLFAFGPIDADLLRRHEAVCRVDAALMGATRPGATLGEIFAVCQKVYADAGFPDEWKLHHQGGLTGYQGRENRATPGSSTRVLPNQAYAWNPSIAGTKSEDTILVLPDRTEIISATGQWPMKGYSAGGRTWMRN